MAVNLSRSISRERSTQGDYSAWRWRDESSGALLREWDAQRERALGRWSGGRRRTGAVQVGRGGQLPHRQGDAKHRATTDLAGDLDGAAARLRDLPRDEET